MSRFRIDPFWAAIAGALGVLVLVVSFVVSAKIARRVRLEEEVKREAAELEQARAGTPSRQDVESWTRYKAEVLKSRKGVSDYCAGNCRALSRWFPDLPMSPDGDPPRDAFVARYRDEAAALEKRLAAITRGDDEEKCPGFNWEDLAIPRWSSIGRDEERIILRELQKRFWVRSRIAELALLGRVRFRRVVDFRFFRPLHEKFAEGIGGPGALPAASWPGVPPSSEPIPGDWGRELTFGVALELPQREAARALQEILSSGGRDPMLITLIGTHVMILQQNAVKGEFTYVLGNEKDKEAKEREFLGKLRPGFVVLTLTARILDFDPAKMREVGAR